MVDVPEALVEAWGVAEEEEEEEEEEDWATAEVEVGTAEAVWELELPDEEEPEEALEDKAGPGIS